jgi:hypothetical protein
MNRAGKNAVRSAAVPEIARASSALPNTFKASKRILIPRILCHSIPGSRILVRGRKSNLRIASGINR